MNNAHLLWLDFETGGLDEQRDPIIEVAACVSKFTDPFNAKPVYNKVIRNVGIALKMDEVVWKMHTENGLLEALRTADTTVQDAEQELLAIVPYCEDKEDRWILAGATIHFDMRFMQKYMPELARRLSYRLYDVSGIKLFCRSLGMPKLEPGKAHRAMPDVLESISHGEQCAVWLSDYNMPEAD